MPKALGEAQFVAINTAAGDTTLVAAQAAGVTIRVVAFFILATTAAAVVSFQSGTGGTALTGPMTTAVGAPIFSVDSAFGNFETAAATLLNLHQTGTVQLSGWLVWCTAS